MEKQTNDYQLRYLICLVLLLALFLLLVFLNINHGSVQLSLRETMAILLGHGMDDTGNAIIWEIRLPRMLASIILGGALALAGFLLQTFFNNPIADPYVLGISSGAKLVVAIVMILALSRWRSVTSSLLIAAAFAGSMAATGFVLLVARKVRRSSTLIVSGMMIGYICSAVTDFIITFADDASIVNLHNWSRGSFPVQPGRISA